MSDSITAQELFDHVVKAVVAQGQKSITLEGTCVYRHPDGLKCAAGHAMTDAEFEAFGGMARNGHWFGGDKVPARLVPHRNLISVMQTDHDGAGDTAGGVKCDFVSDYLRRTAITARRFNLTMPVLS